MTITFQGGRDSFAHQDSVITSLKKEEMKFLSLCKLFSDVPFTMSTGSTRGWGIFLGIQLLALSCKSAGAKEIVPRKYRGQEPIGSKT